MAFKGIYIGVKKAKLISERAHADITFRYCSHIQVFTIFVHVQLHVCVISMRESAQEIIGSSEAEIEIG